MKMTAEELMGVAIKEAIKSSEPLRCGVVIAKKGKVLAKAFNKQRHIQDATAHAEILAIRKAGKKLGQKNLEGCHIFCTCEPCIMCLSAIIFSKISKLYFGLNLSEVSEPDKLFTISTQDFLKHSPRNIVVIQNFMETECRKTL